MKSIQLVITIMMMTSAIISSAIQVNSPRLERSLRQPFKRRLDSELAVGSYQGCPAPLSSCPIFSKSINLEVTLSRRNFRRSWECLNLRTDVNSCGSCENDCMEIPKIKDGKCVSGTCKILSCQSGFRPELVSDPETGRKSMKCI